jgi:hypothetical protein
MRGAGGARILAMAAPGRRTKIEAIRYFFVVISCRAVNGCDANAGTWRSHMRMMMLVQFPIEPFNTEVRNGTAGAKIKQILDDAKPEHVWFSEREGKRGGILIANLDSPSDVPRFAEPWFLAFNAEVEFRVAMTPEDLGRANLDALGKKWG